MKKVTNVREGVEKLLTTYHRDIPDFKIEEKRDGEEFDTLILNGERIPILDFRLDQRLRPMAGYGAIGGNSALNAYSFVGCDVSLQSHIYQELAISEFLLNSKIKSITAFVNGNAANVIASMENGSNANLELGTTLAQGSQCQCQHRLYTSHGMTNDRSVGTMTVNNQMAVFTEDSVSPTVYDDDEYYLYGLDENEVRKAMTVHDVIVGLEAYADWKDSCKRFREATNAVFTSASETRTVYIGEEK